MNEHFRKGFMKCAAEDESTALQRILLAGRSGQAPGALGGGLLGFFLGNGSVGSAITRAGLGAVLGSGLGTVLGLGIGGAKESINALRPKRKKKN